MPLLFVYETLRHTQVIEHVLGEIPPNVDSAALNVRKVDAAPDKGEWTLIPAQGYSTEGKVFWVNEEELEKLDEWEEDYHRREVTLENGDKAFAYYLNKKE